MSSENKVDRGQPGGVPIRERLALAFGLLGGAGAWTLHLLLAYVIAEFGCLSAWAHLKIAGATAIAWLIAIVSLMAIALSAAAAFVALGQWRRHRSAENGAAGPASAAYLAQAGFYAGAIFAIAILVQSLPILFYWGSC